MMPTSLNLFDQPFKIAKHLILFGKLSSTAPKQKYKYIRPRPYDTGFTDEFSPVPWQTHVSNTCIFARSRRDRFIRDPASSTCFGRSLRNLTKNQRLIRECSPFARSGKETARKTYAPKTLRKEAKIDIYFSMQ